MWRPMPPLRAASRMAPTAPTLAASVGVATPNRIEPSTAAISAMGASSASIRLPRGASFAATAGQAAGRASAITIR